MVIEYRCDRCGQALTALESATGKQARCPACGALTDIPSRAGLPSPGDPAGPPPPPPTKNRPADAHDSAQPFLQPSEQTRKGSLDQTQAWPSSSDSEEPPPKSLLPDAEPEPQIQPAAALDDNYAAQRVSGPAITLMVLSAITLVTMAMGLVSHAVGDAVAVIRDPISGPNLNVLSGSQENALSATFAALVFYGAWKMKRLESYSLAMTAAVLAMIPCFSPTCCLVGVPIGIWSASVLSDPSVKSAFKS